MLFVERFQTRSVHNWTNADVETTWPKIAADISISLKAPTLVVEEKSEELKKQNMQLKKNRRSLSNYTRRLSRRKNPSPGMYDHGSRPDSKLLEQECEIRRRASLQDGQDFLHHFLHYHFKDHVDIVRIISTKTLEEIRMIANEPPSVGIRQCRRLFNAPVISDQIGSLLFEELKQGGSLDHSHQPLALDMGTWRIAATIPKEWRPPVFTEELDEVILVNDVSGAHITAWTSEYDTLHLGHCDGHTFTSSSSSTLANEKAATELAMQEIMAPTTRMKKKRFEGLLDRIKARTTRGTS